MKQALIGIAGGVIMTLAAEFVFLTKGGLPVPTAGGPLPFERLISRMALHHAIGSDASIPSPEPATLATLLDGARIYHEQCAFCHGYWGEKPSSIAKGMFPAPPSLLPPKKGVTDDPVGETYWKVKNGIRLTGMPAYSASLSEKELWEVSQILRQADHLSAEAQNALRR